MHSVTSDSPGVFDVTVQPHDKAFLLAPTRPGHYGYHCTYHPGMHGELAVS
ncbi:hypothetical protein [Mycobacterium sp. OAS707]|uniref:cupredoxin domain-containing protein n=1 Tax=Mycobacterium sp. OAS707 TaxID=2663822 RepID=UPI00351C3BE3